MPERPLALFAMSAETLPHAFPPDVLARLRASVDIDPGLIADGGFDDPAVRTVLAEAEVLITGWGCPAIDASVLDAAPKLRAVLHAAGSVKSTIAPGLWDRGLVVSSAADANALPVAEYTLGMIMLVGKDLLTARERYRTLRTFPLAEIVPGIGNFRRRIGIVGASRIGRRVIELLRPFDFDVSLADPYVDEAEAAALGVRLLPLGELLAGSDIVSVHAPATDETRHLIGAAELALMPDGSVLINTARGSLVDTDALVAELRTGRLKAVLDVTDPEPLPANSPLFDLPGAFITPHLAGSQGNEVQRLGLCVVEELERLLAGRPLSHQVDPAALERAA
ncbi:hydroxyacid dehydrogenase [Streptomyces sp. PSKA54]|uniref:Hydroxyacid dehydrogenase n=1 Tax=Streptomyces himalayensis subsp. aureolus TaxID=2758039 RepID=A0A7W2HJM0_9ACTN|nr:hydroxyacid dehydrogenase [Streptomyces himalayensis]MBA4866265.1 hydroxyacid dehydrogenase [Streptomyces himalayensis subsp. aureolus]